MRFNAIAGRHVPLKTLNPLGDDSHNLPSKIEYRTRLEFEQLKELIALYHLKINDT